MHTLSNNVKISKFKMKKKQFTRRGDSYKSLALAYTGEWENSECILVLVNVTPNIFDFAYSTLLTMYWNMKTTFG